MSSFAPIRGTRTVINSTPIVDGQFLIETDQTDTTGNKIYLDNGSTRIHVGGAREASDIVYDNTETSTIISATDVQDAIDETVSAIENIMGDVAYIESTTTATRTGGYAVGNYLICLALGTKLYKVTTAIANGGTIDATSGTGNVTETTVATELATLNSEIESGLSYDLIASPTSAGTITVSSLSKYKWIAISVESGYLENPSVVPMSLFKTGKTLYSRFAGPQAGTLVAFAAAVTYVSDTQLSVGLTNSTGCDIYGYY